ncbi:MAG: hypothetical protein O2973_07545 [Gemmatimonadetes bacterium]|nr:hypothetical protein [Gemmatimonadota bacterium]
MSAAKTGAARGATGSATVAKARPFVTALRTPRGVVVRVGGDGPERVTLRVQFEALWDAVAFDIAKDEPLETLIRAALGRFGQGELPMSEFVTKLNGWEVMDMGVTVAESGARDGSTFLVAHRFRRPVR